MNRILITFALISLWTISADAQPMPPLTLQKTIPLPGVTGRFDHLAIDTAGNRLFIAAPGNHSVEVIELTTNKVEQSITGLGKPHGLAWVAATGSLYVADGALGELRVYKGTPLALAGKIKLSDDADDMVYDDATPHALCRPWRHRTRLIPRKSPWWTRRISALLRISPRQPTRRRSTSIRRAGESSQISPMRVKSR